MSSLNKVFVMGNLGADPELRVTPDPRTQICTLRVATNERRKNAQGEWSDHTEWHSIVAFGKTAENCAQFLAKGRTVFVEGRIQTRKWTDKEGQDRYRTEIVANNVQFVGGRGGEMNIERSSSQGSGSGSFPQAAAASQQKSGGGGEYNFDAPISFDDDDIPF